MRSGITIPDPKRGGQRKETTPPAPQQPPQKRLRTKTNPPRLPATTEAKKKGKRNPKPEAKPKAKREKTNSPLQPPFKVEHRQQSKRNRTREAYVMSNKRFAVGCSQAASSKYMEIRMAMLVSQALLSRFTKQSFGAC